MNKKFFLLLCIVSVNVSANALFANADVAAGKALHDKNCVGCHASSYGGDGSAIYTREYNKVKTSKGLLAQVRAKSFSEWRQMVEDSNRASSYRGLPAKGRARIKTLTGDELP